jgi:HEPN domain-containing protein
VNVREKYEYWLDTALYDLETAEAMLQSGRHIYVMFMCEQAIEKLVKGLYILYVDDNVPRTHNIRVLVERFEDKLPEAVTEERYALFEDLTLHYISGRYTDYKQKLSERLNKEKILKFYRRTQEAFAWLLTLTP